MTFHPSDSTGRLRARRLDSAAEGTLGRPDAIVLDGGGHVGGFAPAQFFPGGPLGTSGSPSLGSSHSPTERGLMTLEQAAVKVGVSVRTLARYRKSGALEVVKVGRRVLCTVEAIQRAMVRRSLQQIWREILDPGREVESLRSWLTDVQALAEKSPQYEAPALHERYVAEVCRRFPNHTVGEYTIADLSTVVTALESGGVQLESARYVLTYPPSAKVIDALRALHERFGP